MQHVLLAILIFIHLHPTSHALDEGNSIWGKWVNWAECPTTCGGSSQTRTRVCIRGPCSEEPAEWRRCGLSLCPGNTTWRPIYDWNGCYETCGQCEQFRYRLCIFADRKACGYHPCPGNSTWGPWGDWTGCSKTSEGGYQTRARICIRGPCSGEHVEKRVCQYHPCPVNATWSLWSDWTSCSKTCGGGQQTRIRQIDVYETRVCTYQPCPASTICTQSCTISDLSSSITVPAILQCTPTTSYHMSSIHTSAGGAYTTRAPVTKRLVAKAKIAIMKNFSKELTNKSSPEYKKTELQARTALTEIYKNMTGFLEVAIIGFQNGSTIISYAMYFDKKKQPSTEKLRDRIIHTTLHAISKGLTGGLEIITGTFQMLGIIGNEEEASWFKMIVGSVIGIGIALVTLVKLARRYRHKCFQAESSNDDSASTQ